MTGMLPKDHLPSRHVACSPNFRWCVPVQVHAKLKAALGTEDAHQRLLAFYEKAWSTLPADAVIGDAFRFWQPLFDAEFASKPVQPKKAAPAYPVPDAETTRRRLLPPDPSTLSKTSLRDALAARRTTNGEGVRG